MRLFLEHDYETVRLFLDHDCICDYQNWPFIIFVKTTKFSHIYFQVKLDQLAYPSRKCEEMSFIQSLQHKHPCVKRCFQLYNFMSSSS